MNHPVLQGHQFSVRCRLATGSPKPIPQSTHTTHMATLLTHSTRPLYNIANTTANLISCMGMATQPLHNHTHSMSSPPSSRSLLPVNSNSGSLPHQLTLLHFRPLQGIMWEGSKVTCHERHAHVHTHAIDFPVHWPIIPEARTHRLP